jgi:hypothetical protein
VNPVDPHHLTTKRPDARRRPLDGFDGRGGRLGDDVSRHPQIAPSDRWLGVVLDAASDFPGAVALATRAERFGQTAMRNGMDGC